MPNASNVVHLIAFVLGLHRVVFTNVSLRARDDLRLPASLSTTQLLCRLLVPIVPHSFSLSTLHPVMDATLTDGMAIRTLARVLTAAAKIGDNICVEPQARSLALRALSSQKSAAVEFVLDGTFFDTYLLLPSPLTQAPGGGDGSLPSTPVTPVTPRSPSPPPAVVVAAKLLLPIAGGH